MEAKLTTEALKSNGHAIAPAQSEQVRSEIEHGARGARGRGETICATSVAEATDVGAKLRAHLPVVAAGALGAGFLLAGGIGATVRLIFRRGREGETKAPLGRFRLVDRD